MAKWLDDFLFYLPGFASVPIAVAGMLGLWLAWRLVKSKKKIPPQEQAALPVEKPEKR